jgi:hypothetical protein
MCDLFNIAVSASDSITSNGKTNKLQRAHKEAIHCVRMTVSLARQVCNEIHKVQEEGEGQEIHCDKLH